MITVFLPTFTEPTVKKSGDLIATGSVCPVLGSDLIQLHIKTMAGSFLPPYIKIRKRG